MNRCSPRSSHADCVVVGGGLIGCSIALRLARRGLIPLVVDPGTPGAEASSAAPGILSPQIEAEGPGPVLELGLLSRAKFSQLSDDLQETTGIDVGFRRCGALIVADEAGLAALEERAQWQATMGLRLERLTPEQTHRLEPNLGPVAGAVYFPEEAQVEAPLLTRATELAALRAGARFLRGRVTRVVAEGQRVAGVIVDGHRLAAERVVIAAGSWSSLIEGALLPPGSVGPLRGQVVEIEVRPVPLRTVVFMPDGYLVPRRDGRVLLGSTMEAAGYEKCVTTAGLAGILARALRALPLIAHAPITRQWAGLRPTTPDRLPCLGPTPLPGLFHATGHYRKGILLSAISSEAVAACVLGESPPVDLGPYAVTRFAAPVDG